MAGASQHRDKWRAFRNDAGETIPAYAVMRMKDGERSDNGEPILIADKPDGTGEVHMLNGPTAVPATGSARYGKCAAFHGQLGLYDDGNTPGNGEEWGASSGSWKLTKDNPGFWIIGGSNGTTVLVAPQASAAPGMKWGFLDGSLSQGSSATLSVCAYDGSNNQYDTDDNITVWDGLLNNGQDAIPANTRAMAHWCSISERWILGSANCQAEDSENLPQVPE